MAVEKLSPIRKFLSNGVNKKSIFYSGIIVLAALISIFLIWHFSKISKKEIFPEIKKEKPMEEILKDLVPKETKPMTEEERKEMEKTLQQLTPPKKAEPMDEKEMEEMLKQLTPP